jgi:sugar lactone lactonase YvrE
LTRLFACFSDSKLLRYGTMRTMPSGVLLVLACSLIQAAETTTSPVARQYVNLPLAFERQTDNGAARYVARGQGYRISLTDTGASIRVQPASGAAAGEISMEFAGGRSKQVLPGRELPGKVNYIRGNDPRQWQIGLPTYEQVTYKQVYPGIDVVYRGNQRQLEFDLVLRPGTDVSAARLKFGGARCLWLDADGALLLGTAAGDLKLGVPGIYQEVDGVRKAIRGRYKLLHRQEVVFQAEEYDRTKPLVIDPTIVYSALLGGGTNPSYGQAIALDSAGNAYLTGYTNAADFPTTGAAAMQYQWGNDGFVTKINAAGTALLYSTYIGGATGNDNLKGIAVDASGAAWVTGYTNSVDFPVVNPYQSTLNTTYYPYDAVVFKLSATGTLLYSTYLGPGSQGWGITVDSTGNAYVCGNAYAGFPTTPGAYLTANQGSTDTFVAKFGASGSLVYSTYVGGTGGDYPNGVAVDSSGNAYVTGYTYSTGFTNAPPGGVRTTYNGNQDAFVAKLNAAGSALSYFTFVGGSFSNVVKAIAVDGSGNAYVAGTTASGDFPTTPGALQSGNGNPGNGLNHGFVAKLNSTGSAFLYATYLGGNRADSANAVAIDLAGNAYVAGSTDSDRFPTAAAVEGTLPGNTTSLFRTTDGGATWSPFDINISGAVFSLLVDPSNSNTLVAGAEGGVFRSTNGGASWTFQYPTTMNYLSRSPANGNTIYGFSGSSAYRSTDGGLTWTLQGSIPSSANGLVADPLNANTAYAYFRDGTPELFKTTNGGVNWSLANSGIPTANIQAMAAALDGTLYVAATGQNICKSTNQGATWAVVNSGLGNPFTPSVNGLALSPANASVLYASHGATNVMKTTNGGASWSPTAANLPAGVALLAASPANPSTVFAASNGINVPVLYLTTNGGTTWTASAAGMGIGTPTQIVFDPSNPANIYAVAAVRQSAFVSKINPAGAAFVYSTYLGSLGGATVASSIAANSAGDALVSGYSAGSFPVTTTAFQGNTANNEAFAVRISDATAACSYTVSPPNQTTYSGSVTFTYSVLAPSGCAWTASSNQSWATVTSGTSGTGSGGFTIYVPTNDTGAARTATLTVAGQTASLTQASVAACGYGLSSSGTGVGPAGGSVQVDVFAASGCLWTVTNNYPSAITVVSGAPGTGNGTVTLSVAPTISPNGRSFSVGIANQTFVVSQGGTCTFSIGSTTALFNGAGGTGSVAVTSNPGNCSWGISSDSPSWLTITSPLSGFGSATINYSVAPATGTGRTGNLNIMGQTFTVTQSATNQVYLIETLAGGMMPPMGVPGASVALPQLSYGVAADSSGNVYFSSASQSVVFRLSASGVLTIVAGQGGPSGSGPNSGYWGDGDQATRAGLNGPRGLAVDTAGNLYIADFNNYRVRKVDTSGIITTVAGNGSCCYSGDGSAALQAQIRPSGVAVDAANNLYIAETGNYRVRKVAAATGNITTVAGNGTNGFSGDNGPATSAQISSAYAVAVDGSGNLYIADRNNYRIRKVAAGAITTIAGTGANGFSGDNGPAASAQISSVYGLTVDGSGNLYIADIGNLRIRKVSGGTITTVAGNGVAGFSGDGGAATSASFETPYGVAVDGSGSLYISDWSNNRIRKVAGGTINTVAGGSIGDNGPAVFAGLSSAGGLVKDGLGNVYVADSFYHRVRKISSAGVITTVAGTGISGYSGDNGPATSAQLNSPGGLALDGGGNLYIADSANNRIRKVTAGGTITTFAGSGTPSYSGDNGPAISAQLNNPDALLLDGANNLYISDTGNYRIRMVAAATGNITTVAGNGTSGFSGDNGPATSAQISAVYAMTFDSLGNGYLADSGNYRIRKITNGTITTVAGTGANGYSGDGGPAASAQISSVFGLAADASGNLYLGDSGNNRIRVISGGTISTLAGTGSYGYGGDAGSAAAASFADPQALTVDASGDIYVVDADNGAVRLIVPANTQPVFTLDSPQPPFGPWFPGGNGAGISLVVTNVQGAGVTSGPITLAWILDPSLTVASISGSGWNCSQAACTFSGALAANASSPPLTTTFNIAPNAPATINLAGTVSGGGAAMTGARGSITLPPPPALSVTKTHSGNFTQGQTAATYTVVVSDQAGVSPTSGTVTVTETIPSGLSLVSMAGTGWTCASNSCTRSDALAAGASYDPITVTVNVTASATSPQVNQVTVSGGGSASNSASDSTVINPAVACTYALGSLSAAAGAGVGSGSVTVTAPSGCAWTASSSATSWLNVTSGSSGSGSGTVNYSVTANPGATPRTGALTIAGQTFTVTQTDVNSPALRFIPMTPCRVVDTRNPAGPFGGPSIGGGASRDFNVPTSACGVPSTAQAYSLNVAVVPAGPLGYLTLWPTGQTQPLASTLNSLDGRIKSNAAIVPAGTSGSISVFASNATDVILDINGYFVPASVTTALAFYPITPCRIADTRTATATLGGPSLGGGSGRTFPIQSSACGLPATAQAYSLNFAAVPPGPLGYVTAWPTGQAMPLAASLNALTGTVTANAAIVPAGTAGSIDVFASNPTNLVIDVNGYFAPMATGGLSLYGVTPCRVLDTRLPSGSPPITSLDVAVSATACGIPSAAQADVLSVTVVPPGPLGYMTLWPQGQTMPVASTLNALDGSVTSNLAIVPTASGSISVFPSNPTHVVMDISGYFGQ